MEQTVTAAVHEAVTAASEAVGQAGNEEEVDSSLTWVDVVAKGRRKKMKQKQKKLLIIKSNDDENATAKKDEVGRALDDVQILDSRFTKAECIKCETCDKYLHPNCSKLPAYALVNWFTTRHKYKCELCVRTSMNEEDYDRKFAFVSNLLLVDAGEAMENESENNSDQDVSVCKQPLQVIINAASDNLQNDTIENENSSEQECSDTEQSLQTASVDPNKSNPPVNPTLPSTTNTSNSNNTYNSVKNSADDNKKIKICKFYKTHSCIYGRSGKKCNYAHPKVCYKHPRDEGPTSTINEAFANTKGPEFQFTTPTSPSPPTQHGPPSTAPPTPVLNNILTANIEVTKPNYTKVPELPTNFSDLNFFSQYVSWDGLCAFLNSTDWSTSLDHLNPNEQLDLILDTFLKASIQNVPPRSSRNTKSSIIPKDRRLLMRKRGKLRKKLNTTTNNDRFEQLTEQISSINAALVDSTTCELAHKEAMAVKSIKENPKYFYTYAFKKSKIKTPVGPLKEGDKTITDPQEISDIIRKQYETVFSIPLQEKTINCPVDFFMSTDHANQDQQLHNITINTTDIIDAIKTLSNNSAAGPDHIPAIFLKRCAGMVAKPLLIFYQNSLATGIVPQLLRSAKITPVFKGGSRGEAKNYRPIALTSHIIKVLEKIITKKITTYLEDSNKMNDGQHGFRRG
ncbi:hypothetical protein Pcinc_003051 [Petrolisthes cinctipes]|uniref:C3H1-type domain-containing protein n=1 Tax=Petrolisthes cinctipes TaxID=88211 RepID=A0AAE1L1P2_PETCI|nr:hypothetical protein Pcinc_003051 [Petrolisthes cinctipes]